MSKRASGEIGENFWLYHMAQIHNYIPYKLRDLWILKHSHSAGNDHLYKALVDIDGRLQPLDVIRHSGKHLTVMEGKIPVIFSKSFHSTQSMGPAWWIRQVMWYAHPDHTSTMTYSLAGQPLHKERKGLVQRCYLSCSFPHNSWGTWIWICKFCGHNMTAVRKHEPQPCSPGRGVLNRLHADHMQWLACHHKVHRNTQVHIIPPEQLSFTWVMAPYQTLPPLMKGLVHETNHD